MGDPDLYLVVFAPLHPFILCLSDQKDSGSSASPIPAI